MISIEIAQNLSSKIIDKAHFRSHLLQHFLFYHINLCVRPASQFVNSFEFSPQCMRLFLYFFLIRFTV